MLELLSRTKDPTKMLESLPDSISTPELNMKLEAEGDNHRLIEKLQKNAKFEGASEILTIDGLRVEYPDGFGLMRASNTTPVLVLRFEADNDAALASRATSSACCWKPSRTHACPFALHSSIARGSHRQRRLRSSNLRFETSSRAPRSPWSKGATPPQR